MEFQEKLQELRKQKGLTQEKLAESLYVSRTAVSKWELGSGYPNLDFLKAIARFFGITIDELLSGNVWSGLCFGFFRTLKVLSLYAIISTQ